MVTNTTAIAEVVDDGELRDRLGRMITPSARRAELVAAWRASGMTQAAFARSEGINYTTFCSWVQDQRKRHTKCLLDGFVMGTNPIRTTTRGASYW